MTGKDDTSQPLAASASGCAEESTRGQLSQPPPGTSDGSNSSTGGEHGADRPVQINQLSVRKSQDTEVPRGMLERTLQAQLGRQLRSIYADIASEPVPERFIKLLQELEAREKRQ
jgi:hypothetical protein